MKNLLIAIAVIGALVFLGFVFMGFGQPEVSPAPLLSETASSSEDTWVCTADAKICPDGSTVGRSGPQCEFAACPSTDVTSDTVSTFLGGQVTQFNLTVNPRVLVSDSRCPQSVTCVTAGTVEVRTVVSSPTGHGEHVFVLDQPRTVGDHTVTLVEVTPSRATPDAIPEHEYRFTYRIDQ